MVVRSAGALSAVLAFAAVTASVHAQSPPKRPAFDAFEEAVIKPTHSNYQVSEGRIMMMQGAHRFTAQHYTLQALIAAAFQLNPRAILGGPDWIDSDRYDIVALTPHGVRPNSEEQMTMLRKLLSDRFHLQFHEEQKTISIYALTVAKPGKLKETASSPDDPTVLVNRIFPDRVFLPARNATMSELAAMLQRVVLDRPVVDKTGLSGKYDFDLEWSPANGQFGGQGPPESAEPTKPSIFTALQETLGLKLQATKGPTDVLIVDRAERPTEN